MVQSLKDVIDCVKLQTGESFPAKELQVLVTTEAKERELVAYMLTLCFHSKSEDILCIKYLFAVYHSWFQLDSTR